MKKYVTFLLLLITATALSQPVMRWQKNYGGSASDTVYSVKETFDKGFIVAGLTRSNNLDVTGNHGDADYWVVKLDASGNIVWKRCYGGPNRDVARSAIQTLDGGYIVAGYSNSKSGDVTDHNLPYSTPGSYYDAWVIKLNSTGDITWSKSLLSNMFPLESGSSDNITSASATTVIQTADGGYMIGGKRRPSLFYEYNDVLLCDYFSWAVKLSNSGVLQWESKPYGSFTSGLLREEIGVQSIVQVGSTYWILSAGYVLNAYTAGDCITQPYSYRSTYLYRISGTGQYLNGHIYGSYSDPAIPNDTTYTLGRCMRQTNDGGFIVCGRSTGSTECLAGAGNHGGNDFWVFKTNSSGVLEWSKCYGGTGFDVPNSIHQAADGNYYVAGLSNSSNGNVTDHIGSDDIWVCKLNSSGTLLWTKSYGGTGTDLANALTPVSDGGYVVAGASTSTYSNIINKGNTDWLLTKFDDCGTVPMPTAPSPQSFSSCIAPKVSNLVATGTNLKWYSSLTSATALSLTASLPNGTYTYYVTQSTVTGCTSARKAVGIIVSGACRPAAQNTGATDPVIAVTKPTVMPNPNSGIFKLILPVDNHTRSAIVNIINAAGQTIWKKQCTPVNGWVNEEVNIAPVQSGVYIVQYADNNGYHSIKMMKR